MLKKRYGRLTKLSVSCAFLLVQSSLVYAQTPPPVPLSPKNDPLFNMNFNSQQSQSSSSSTITETEVVTQTTTQTGQEQPASPKDKITSVDEVPIMIDGAYVDIVDRSKGQLPIPDVSNVQFRSINGQKLSTDLNAEDVYLIEQKRGAIIKYLYEQRELEQLRQMLGEEKRVNDYNTLLQESYPLNQNEILELRRREAEVQQAQNKPVTKVESVIRAISTDDLISDPITLNVVAGFASSVIFYDENGNPWEIEGEIIGNANAFTMNKMGQSNNIAVFNILSNFSESNALVNLKGLDVSIVLRLVGSLSTNDSRLSVRIPRTAPDFQLVQYTPTPDSPTSQIDQDLLDVANGTPLVGGTRYKLNGVEADVFYKNNFLYIRSKYQLTLPLPKEAQRTPNGLYAYKLSPTEDFTFLVNGEMKYASIEESFNVPIKYKTSLFK